jgi:hypothetical protein
MYFNLLSFLQSGGTVGWGTALQVGRSQVVSPTGLLKFFIDLIVPAALWPWGWLVSDRNEYQGYVLRGKGGGWVGLTTLPASCADFLEFLGASTSWSLQGLSRPVMDSFFFLQRGKNWKLMWPSFCVCVYVCALIYWSPCPPLKF